VVLAREKERLEAAAEEAAEATKTLAEVSAAVEHCGSPGISLDEIQVRRKAVNLTTVSCVAEAESRSRFGLWRCAMGVTRNPDAHLGATSYRLRTRRCGSASQRSM
jgi:hypothetical protein